MENGCTQPGRVCAAICLGMFCEGRSVSGGFRIFGGKLGRESAERRVDEALANRSYPPCSPGWMMGDRTTPRRDKSGHSQW